MKSSRTIIEKFYLFVATGFGIGLFAPFAPGTFGSLPGVALAYLVSLMPLYLQIVVCTGLVLLAIPFCDVAEKILGLKDDGRITADEWMLFPLSFIGIPILDLPWWSMVIFFAVVRFMDIIKLPPARQLQSIPGGRGIVIDDFIANLYSLALNWVIYLCFFK
jgi:phosphatidylglycerophosphatase A